MSKYIASIDVGTTNIKINLFHSTYEVIDVVIYPHTDIYITDIVFELSLNEIWTNILKGLNELIHKYKIKKLEVILTTAMHSIQLMEEDFSLTDSLIVWADKRGEKAIKNLREKDLKRQYFATGAPTHSMNPFFKLLELREEVSKKKRVGSLKDILFYRLTGEWAIDVSNASSSGLYNLHDFHWDKETLKTLGISENQLPSIKSTKYKKTTIHSLFNADVSVYIGTSDGVSSNYVFNNLEDTAVLSIGTSHAVRVVHKDIKLNSTFQNFAYEVTPGTYLTGLPSNNGGDILAWANKVFNSTFAELDEIAKLRPETRSIFLPFLNGERAPIWDEYITGDLYNLTRTSTRESVLFSIILGMFFNIKYNVDNLAKMTKFKSIGLVGGITKLSAFPQLIADILGYKIYIPTMENAETLGSISVVKDMKFESTYKIIEPKKVNPYSEMYKAYLGFVRRKDS